MPAVEIVGALQNWGLRLPDNEGLIIFAVGCSLIALPWLFYMRQRWRALNEQLRRFDQSNIFVPSQHVASLALANSAGALSPGPTMFSDDLSADRPGYIRLREDGLTEGAGGALPSIVPAPAEIQAATA
jgi:hypothetical protein